MFKKLKDKLKGALDSLTGKVSAEAIVEEPEPRVEDAEDVSSEPEAAQDTKETVDDSAKEPDDTPEEPEQDDDTPEEPEELADKSEQTDDKKSNAAPKTSADTIKKETAEDRKEEPEELADEEAKKTPEEDAEPKTAQETAADGGETEKKIPTRSIFKKMFGKKEPEETRPEKQDDGFFTKLSQRITTIQLSEEKFEELFWDFELALLENNVAVSVIEKIKEDLKDELTTGRQARGEVKERIVHRLEQSLREVLAVENIDLEQSVRKHSPLIICMVGVNGSGKTTTAAKLGAWFSSKEYSVVFAAADTFRAAAIQQLEEHAKKLSIPLIKQEYGADPAAVAYDAIEHAKAKKKDVVIIDTAGRLHSNTNLMDELEKVVRVAKPHHIIFVGEAVTGNDCVEQAEKFSEKLAVDGVILTKADVDQSGGAAISVSFVTGSPIMFLGVGQGLSDLKEFSVDEVIASVLPQDL